MQELLALPEGLQAQIADELDFPELLHPVLPSLLLCQRLAALRTQRVRGLALSACSAAQLAALHRDLVHELPHLVSLSIGCADRITRSSRGGALGAILAYLPALEHLVLEAWVDHDVSIARDLPLPVSLTSLDLSGCVFESYTCVERDTRGHLRAGLRAVVADLALLGSLQKACLRVDEDSLRLSEGDDLHAMLPDHDFEVLFV